MHWEEAGFKIWSQYSFEMRVKAPKQESKQEWERFNIQHAQMSKLEDQSHTERLQMDLI